MLNKTSLRTVLASVYRQKAPLSIFLLTLASTVGSLLSLRELRNKSLVEFILDPTSTSSPPSESMEFEFGSSDVPADLEFQFFIDQIGLATANKFIVSPETMFELLQLAENNREVHSLLTYIFVKEDDD